MKSILTLLFLTGFAIASSSQTALFGEHPYNRYPLLLKEHQRLADRVSYTAVSLLTAAKTTNAPVFDTSKWRAALDSVWGYGAANSVKLSIFDQFWMPVDSNYPCFVQLPMYNWDSIINGMRAEINQGVSRGRFAGIIGKLMTYINDGHSHFYDYGINYGTPPFPGMPVFKGQSRNFGACLTTLDDSTAMVYEAEPGHPFGLEKGDVILGYNGIPWKDLVKIILEHQLPNAVALGSTGAATWHRYIQAAGANWYLFDTINIKKCNGDLVNFPAGLMNGTSYSNFCSDQMPIPGVPKLSYYDVYTAYRSFSSGVIAGTSIGYVYMYDCSNISGDSLYYSVKSLFEDSLVTGIVLDIRTNFGGGFGAFEKAFQYIHDGPVSWAGYGERDNYADRYSMAGTGPEVWYDVPDDNPMYLQAPVAILTGPNAISAGDFLPVLFKHDPNVRTFGKSTAGAYGAYQPMSISDLNYFASRQVANFHEANQSFYLSHTEFPVDFPTWFNKDSVCKGVDNIVADAVHWIQQTNGLAGNMKNKPEVSVYPNPAKDHFNIKITVASPEKTTITIYTIEGLALGSFTSELHAGENIIQSPFSELGILPGNYYVVVSGKNLGRSVRKLTRY